jgi:DNA polymerase III subunit delta'
MSQPFAPDASPSPARAVTMPDFVEIERDGKELEADRFQEHPHPREMLWYAGAPETENTLLDAFRGGKLHHAWLLTGPEGIGKATLAYRFARFLLAHPDPMSGVVQQARSLAVSFAHGVTGQIAQMSHPDLAVIRRGLTKDGKSLKAEIAVDDVRDGLSIFRTTAGAGGWRIVIVDAADDLNRASANALLKMLEEPPQRAVFLLVSHSPGALLPTIRSRCRVLRVPRLDDSAVREGVTKLAGADAGLIDEAVSAAGGSLREALAMLDPASGAIRRDANKLLGALERLDGKAAMALADKTTGKAGTAAFEIILDMLEKRLQTGVHHGVSTHKSIAALAAHAQLWEKLRSSARDVETYNLDRRPFLLSIFSELADIERRY